VAGEGRRCRVWGLLHSRDLYSVLRTAPVNKTLTPSQKRLMFSWRTPRPSSQPNPMRQHCKLRTILLPVKPLHTYSYSPHGGEVPSSISKLSSAFAVRDLNRVFRVSLCHSFSRRSYRVHVLRRKQSGKAHGKSAGTCRKTLSVQDPVPRRGCLSPSSLTKLPTCTAHLRAAIHAREAMPLQLNHHVK
jgi:hypothetical protein